MSQNIKIAASQVYKLMTEPKLVKDKEAGLLSETAKSYIEELYLRYKYSYKEIVMTDEMFKGIYFEQEALELIDEYFGNKIFRKKNTEMFENEFLKGIPDIKLIDCIEDVKNSFTPKTFLYAGLDKAYYWQGQSYMALTGVKKYRLIYVLINNTERIILNEKMKLYYKFDCMDENTDYIKYSQQIEQNHNYDRIPIKERVKIIEFDYNEADCEKMYKQIEKAQKYYNSIKDKPLNQVYLK